MDREAAIAVLETTRLDILVVGGGATGAGVALDAASRGLSVGLVERDDIASGTSSRSTKLIHGGVRYLERAVKELDRGQYELVRDALEERGLLVQRLAPHLARYLSILTPLYRAFEVPYFMAGLALYDWVAGEPPERRSRYLPPREARRRFPLLRRDGLKGAVLYQDGQFDDARMNVSIALTAAERGALVASHAAVVSLERTGGRLDGALVEDAITGRRIRVRARVVVNAAGPFADEVRRMDDPAAAPLLTTSSGAHIVLPAGIAPEGTGLLVPRTDDGRVLFVLPWLDRTLVGTTDNPAPLEAHPRASAEDVAYMRRQLARYLEREIEERDVLARWSGLRPLVSAPGAGATARLSRDHVIEARTSGLVTVVGGKWTTYRRMAEDAVDAAVRAGGLSPCGPSRTREIPLAGAEGFAPEGAPALERRFGLEADAARHLHRAYGARAERVAALARERGLGGRLVPGGPWLEAEVAYAARAEGARRVIDVLARRTRVAFVDRAAALAAVPRAAALMAEALGWDAARLVEEEARARAWLA
jgi:glycerol-3-phosphate dehydrogenase